VKLGAANNQPVLVQDHIELACSNLHLVGNDLVVSLVVNGQQGQAGPLTFSGGTSTAGRAGKGAVLQAGQCDRFLLLASQDPGELQQVKVSGVNPAGVPRVLHALEGCMCAILG
jgi:hypothetical protein